MTILYKRKHFLLGILLLSFVLLFLITFAGLPPFKVPNLYKYVENPSLQKELIPNLSFSYEGLFSELPPSNITISSQGLRDWEYSTEKPNKVFRIAGLGDSFTFGLGVNLNETFLKKLEKKLNVIGNTNYQVINFGVPGYNFEQEAELLDIKILDFEPDLIILPFVLDDCYNIDFHTVPIKALNSIFYSFFDTLQDDFDLEDFFRKIGANEILNSIYSKIFYPFAINSEKLRVIYNINFYRPTNSEIENCNLQLKKIKEFLDRENIPLVFIIFLPHYFYNEYFLNNTMHFAKNNFYLLDFDKIFENHNVWDLIFKDGHPNELFHTLATDEIYEFLIKNDLI